MFKNIVLLKFLFLSLLFATGCSEIDDYFSAENNAEESTQEVIYSFNDLKIDVVASTHTYESQETNALKVTLFIDNNGIQSAFTDANVTFDNVALTKQSQEFYKNLTQPLNVDYILKIDINPTKEMQFRDSLSITINIKKDVVLKMKQAETYADLSKVDYQPVLSTVKRNGIFKTTIENNSNYSIDVQKFQITLKNDFNTTNETISMGDNMNLEFLLSQLDFSPNKLMVTSDFYYETNSDYKAKQFTFTRRFYFEKTMNFEN